MTGLPQELFTAPLPGLGRPLSDTEGQDLFKYLEILRKWQKMDRLVGSTATDWVIRNVFLDSLAFLGLFPVSARVVVDVGSGAGIPGIPIAITRRDLSITLIESRRRRASFLSTVIRELSLSHVEVAQSRVEDLGVEYLGRFDVAVARCVSGPERLVALVSPLIRVDGTIIVAAGPDRPNSRGVEVGREQNRHFHVVGPGSQL